MSKRDKKLNVNKLNRLNEEDESVFLEEKQAEENKKKAEEESKQNLAQDIAQEYSKLRGQIEQVFRLVPYCEPSTLNVIDSNPKRLEFLEQALINRLIYNEHEPVNTKKSTSYTSSAAYGTFLSKSFSDPASRPLDPSLKDKILNLNNLNLNNECIMQFSIKKLLRTHEKGADLSTQSEEEEEEDDPIENHQSTFRFESQDHFNLIQNMSKIKYLNLGKNSLKSLPINLINKFENLELLDFSDNLFESIDLVSLTKYKELKELNLSNNYLKWFTPHKATNSINDENDEQKLREGCEELSKNLFNTIERLDLANNQLMTSNCLILSQFRNLKYLNLSNNNFIISENNQLPWQLMSNHLLNLLELNLSKNNKSIDPSKVNTRNIRSDSVVSKAFNCLHNLKILNLSENNLVNIPSDIKDLKHLEELILNKNYIEFIPNELTELKHLKHLSLSDNKLTEFNENFCNYAKFRLSLVKLDLSGNKLKYESFSYKIGLFEKLKILNLAENSFDLIPNTLPKSLEEFNISKNRVKGLMIKPLSQAARADDEILIALDYGEHTNLKRNEKLQNPMLAKRKPTIFEKPDIDQQEELVLPHVFYLRNLKRLNLAQNHIAEIPADFGILNSSLEYLDISSNLLTQINLSLCRGLGSLKHLNVSSNRIRDITDKIRELTELEYLNLGFNRLLNLNYELCNELKSLKELYLNNNYLDQMPIFMPNKKVIRKVLNRPEHLRHTRTDRTLL